MDRLPNNAKQEKYILGPSSGAIHGKRTSGDSLYCIFKIPKCLTHNNHNAYGYQPTVVAIGPYYRGNQQLNWIEGQKKEFKELFIKNTGSGVNEDALYKALALKVSEIRNSYLDLSGAVSEKRKKKNDPSGSSYDQDAHDNKALINMMVLDGCFLLVLFLTNAEKISKENAIFSMPWALPSIRRDLLLLGNQIPLVVLHTLLDTAKFLQPSDLQEIALKFFNGSFKVGERSLVKKHPKFEAKHLLDLIRQTFIFIQPPQTTSATIPAEGDNNGAIARQTRLTLPVNKLRSRGVKFEVKKGARTLLDISFKNGVLQIPEIILDDFMSVFLLNCIAFEQFHANSKTEITSYAMFMGCLINSERDASYLAEKGIIQNYLGTDQDEVSRFFKRILNDYVFDDENSYLAAVIKDVDEYSSNGCTVWWASFKQTYVGSLWIALSKLAALAILLLTIAQVVLAAIALKRGNKQG